MSERGELKHIRHPPDSSLRSGSRQRSCSQLTAFAGPCVDVNLYLDVDGVLVPSSSRPAHWDDWRAHAGSRVSGQLGSAVWDLGLEIVWLTTWREEANTVLCPAFGWPPLRVLRRRPELLWWKLEAVLADQPSEPFVWVDDELDVRRHDFEGLFDTQLRRLGVPYLLVSPVGRDGLGAADLARIADFCAMNG